MVLYSNITNEIWVLDMARTDELRQEQESSPSYSHLQMPLILIRITHLSI